MASEVDRFIDQAIDICLGAVIGAAIVLALLRPCDCGDDRTPTHGDETARSSARRRPPNVADDVDQLEPADGEAAAA